MVYSDAHSHECSYQISIFKLKKGIFFKIGVFRGAIDE